MHLDALTYEIEPNLLFGRPGPAKSRWNLPDLRKKGLAVVVSLVNDNSANDVRAAGLVHYLLPFEDKIHRPYKTANEDLFRIFAEFDKIIERHLPLGQPVLVHCNAGKDRTGLLLTYYLITRKGLSARKAIAAVRKVNGEALSASGFEDVVYALEGRFGRMEDLVGRASGSR